MTTQMEAAAASLLVVWNTLQAKLSTAVNPDDLLMTPEEVAAYTGLSVPALAMMRHRRQGPDDERLKNPEHVVYAPDKGTHEARTRKHAAKR